MVLDHAPSELPRRDADPLLGEHAAGLPGRAWFRNRLWAPGLEDGYGSETFPTLRTAAKEGEAALAAEIEAWIRTLPPPGATPPTETGN